MGEMEGETEHEPQSRNFRGDEQDAGGGAGKGLPAPSGANEKSFPRGAPMQLLAPLRNALK